MLTKPDGLSDKAMLDAVAAGWGLRARRMQYVPVGFGSYHWRVDAGDEQWFATADDLTARRRARTEAPGESLARLSAALMTACSIRDAGMTFVVAPEPTISADVLHVVADRYAVALYPYVAGQTHVWGAYSTREERLAVLDMLAAVHASSESVRRSAIVDDFAIPSRDDLMWALADLAARWDHGPFGDPARLLLARHTTSVERVMEHYDRLAGAVADRPERMVLTHGEPHPGNTITTAEGVVMIDWETALIAPPERDLWSLVDEDPQVTDDYAARTGVTVVGESIELYRLWWDLTEISTFLALFRQPHRETADTRVAWDGLNRYLDPTRWRALR